MTCSSQRVWVRCPALAGVEKFVVMKLIDNINELLGEDIQRSIQFGAWLKCHQERAARVSHTIRNDLHALSL